MTHLGHPEAAIEELVAGFRVPGAVIDFAARLLPQIAPALKPPHSVRRHRGELDLRRETHDDPGSGGSNPGRAEPRRHRRSHRCRQLRAAVRKVLEQRGIRYDLLGEDTQIFDARVDLVPAMLAKGLEFDHVVLLEPADIVAGEPDQVTGLRRLYVCLTRAVTSLVIVHQHDLPAVLAA